MRHQFLWFTIVEGKTIFNQDIFPQATQSNHAVDLELWFFETHVS